MRRLISTRGASVVVVASLLALAHSARLYAQEESDATRASTRVVVVGSRAETENPAELSVPVDVYGSDELARLGEIELAEALAGIATSFNSQRLSIGDGAAFHVATLRGMNPDQVLVLVNGKRRHSAAFPKVISTLGFGTTGTDLRAIPLQAVERIEVLREGAASQYGSNAIAGVINIVLKDASEGVAASTYLGRTSWGDGARLLASANTGVRLGDDGFLNLTMEFSKQEPTTRTGVASTCFEADPAYAPCAEGGKVEQLQRVGEPDYEGVGVVFNAAVPTGESGEFYAFGGYAEREAVSDGPYTKADWMPRNVSYVHPDGFFPKEASTLTDRSAVLGLRGDLSEWSADVSLRFGQGGFAFDAVNSINPSYAAEYLAGNPGASDAAIASNAGPSDAFGGSLSLRELEANADFTRAVTLAGRTGVVALGAAMRRESFWMEAGELASYACGPSNTPGSFLAAHHQNDGSAFASCGIQGYPGYSPQSANAGERDRTSVGAYADVEFRSSESPLSVGGALRFENYSDAGNVAAGKVAGRLDLGESGAALRASASTGFRAPGLPQRGFNTVVFQGSGDGLAGTGFLPEGDAVACQDFGACSLQHETSMSVAGGLVYSHARGFLLTADYYRVAVADAVVLTEGLGSDHGLQADAQFQGRPVDGVAFWTNGVDTRTWGVDLVGAWRFSAMSWGAADLSVGYHRNETEITDNRNPAFVRRTQRTLITEAQPKHRVGASVGARSGRGFGAQLRVNRIGKTTSPTVFEEPVEVPAATIVDLEADVVVGDRVRLTVGAGNLFDTLPAKLPSDHLGRLWSFEYPNESPYGVLGRVAFVKVDVSGS